MNIFTGNLISRSYIQRNLGEPILLHVFLLGALYSSNQFSKIWFPLELNVRNKDPARIL
jgi:hypothetical protein